jgi:hypothetical protein
MADTIIRGDGSLVEGPINITFQPGKGGTTTRTFTGNETNIRSQATLLAAEGFSTNMTGGPVWTLTATLSGDVENQPTPQWEIIPHEVERDILECTDRPFIQSLTSTTKDLIEYAIKNPLNHVGLTADGAEADATQFANAWLVYTLMRAGVTARQEFTIAVKRTITVSLQYNPTWSIANVGKIFSRAGLIGAYGIPTNVAALLPVGGSSIENAGSAVSPLYVFYGFLEQYPNIVTVSGNKLQISQTWIYNRWSAGDSGLYPVA